MKQRFFIDIDNTMIDTIDAFCLVYNELYCNHPQFKTAEANLVNIYNFSDQCPLVKNVLEIFEHELFFKFAQPINENTYEILEKLTDKFQLTPCSIGTPKNVAHKAHYLEKHFPFIKDYVLITNQGCQMNKGIVNMEGAVFLDDIPSNLISSNCNKEDKYLFGKIYPWNCEGWNGNWVRDWTEVGEMLL